MDAIDTIQSEKLAYWYFRLNGCLMIENLVVHPDHRGGQRTDVDIVGVRFPHRCELRCRPMIDDDVFRSERSKPLLFIAEVKLGECELNGPWTNSGAKNLERVLRWMGAIPTDSIGDVADALYKNHQFECDDYSFRLFAVGNQVNQRYSRERPNVIQLIWSEILEFIHKRFRDYWDEKKDHSQWDRVGRFLWDTAGSTQCTEFVQRIKAALVDDRGRRLIIPNASATARREGRVELQEH